MSSKSDEIVLMNYSFPSENEKKGEESQKRINKVKQQNLEKKQNLFKSPSLSGSKNTKYKNLISLPALDNNIQMRKPKLHFTSSSFNKNKINLSLTKKSNRTFNFSSTLAGDKKYLNNGSNNELIKNEAKKEESTSKTIELLKKEISNKNKIIESLITSKNNLSQSPEHKNNLVNILSTKKKEQNNENLQNGKEEEGPNESKIMEKKFNDIKINFEKQQKQIGTLRKQEKISKDKETEMNQHTLPPEVPSSFPALHR